MDEGLYVAQEKESTSLRLAKHLIPIASSRDEPDSLSDPCCSHSLIFCCIGPLFAASFSLLSLMNVHDQSGAPAGAAEGEKMERQIWADFKLANLNPIAQK